MSRPLSNRFVKFTQLNLLSQTLQTLSLPKTAYFQATTCSGLVGRIDYIAKFADAKNIL